MQIVLKKWYHQTCRQEPEGVHGAHMVRNPGQKLCQGEGSPLQTWMAPFPCLALVSGHPWCQKGLWESPLLNVLKAITRTCSGICSYLVAQTQPGLAPVCQCHSTAPHSPPPHLCWQVFLSWCFCTWQWSGISLTPLHNTLLSDTDML